MAFGTVQQKPKKLPAELGGPHSITRPRTVESG